jgi:hypothetical protein
MGCSLGIGGVMYGVDGCHIGSPAYKYLDIGQRAVVDAREIGDGRREAGIKCAVRSAQERREK